MVLDRALTVEEICNKLRPIFGKKIDEIYFQYTVAPTKDEREEIAHLLNALYQKNLSKLLDKGVLLEPPEEEFIDGTYDIATVSYAGKKLFPFKLRDKDWPRHVCITGMSGSGKTTLAFSIIEELNKNKKKFLIFDWKKSFRPLIHHIPDLMNFTIGDEQVSNFFKLNVNKPPKGVAPKEWIGVLCDLLVESFMASFGVHKVLLETLDEAFKEWGIYQGSDNYPTWNHIKWRLEEKFNKTEGRESGWIESALRIATVLTFGEFGKVVNYKGDNAVGIEDILDKKVVMELNALGNVEKKFFCEFVLTYIYKLKKARQNEVDFGFDHAILVDEAHNIFLKKMTTFTNESVTDMIYREMREYGTSLICLDQHISKISDTVKGNSACSIAFQQQLPADIEDASRLMQLWEKKHFFSSLPVGSAIVKLSERYTSPFLIEVPFSKIRLEKVTNEDVKGRMQAMMMNEDFAKGVDKSFNEAIVHKPIQTIEREEVVFKPELQPIEPVFVTKKELPREEKLEINVPRTEPSPQNYVVHHEGRLERVDNEYTDEQNELSMFTPRQRKMHDFVLEYLAKGYSLKEIEHILEEGKHIGNFTSTDVLKVINHVFSDHFKVTFKKAENIKNAEIVIGNDEQKFIEFLREHPTHSLSTVELYKALGLSPRKGNRIKATLEEKQLLKVITEKSDKGWKKYIRLE